MTFMNGQLWLDQMINHYRRYKTYCEKAVAQINDKDFFTPVSGNPMSIALLMKHLAGNNISRWTDFLTTDGEKETRNRDVEFLLEGETRKQIYEKWEKGWQIMFDEFSKLTEAYLEKTITIRGEPLLVSDAIQRNLAHAAYHAGQIVHLAKHFAGDKWQTLSIAVGKSEEYNRKMRGKYGNRLGNNR